MQRILKILATFSLILLLVPVETRAITEEKLVENLPGA